MGRIPDDDIARVREASDIVSVVTETVPLRQRGRLWWGLCPFHSEKTPSFKVDPATQLWYCFGCSEGGDVIAYVMKLENLEFAEAVRSLADRAHIEIHEEGTGLARGEKDRLIGACEAAADFFHARLLHGKDAGATTARDYLAGRGFGIDVAKRFRLGYAPAGRDELASALTSSDVTRDDLLAANLAVRDERGGLKDRFFNRIMFPIGDLTGRTVGFGGRVLGHGQPKYLNSAESAIFHKSANLYGLTTAKNAISISGTAVVVEGYTDVIALHEAGIRDAVATLGTALTARHVKLLARFAKRVVYLFDGDEAGQRAAGRASEFLEMQATPETTEGRLDFRVAVIPGGADPAEFVGGPDGPALLRTLLDEAPPLVRFLLDRALDSEDLTTPENRSAALRGATGILGALRGSILAHDYVEYVAGRLLVDYETVDAAVRAAPSEAKAPGSRLPGSAPRPAASTRLDVESRAESELLALAAAYPRLRGEARELLGEGLVTDPDRAAVLEGIVTAGEATGAELISALEARVPGASATLSAGSVDERGGQKVDSTFWQLAGRLRELALRRRISALQARLHAMDAAQDKEAYDKVFAATHELQKRLERQKAHPASNDTTEA